MEENREMGFGVWEFGEDERDYVAARSQEEAERWYREETGLSPEEYGPVREVNIDRLRIRDAENPAGTGADGRPVYPRYTAREWIRRILANGGELPGIIGTTSC